MDPTRKKARTESNMDSAAMTSENAAMAISDSGGGGGGDDDDVPQEWRAFFDKHKSHFETLEKKPYVEVFEQCREKGLTNGSKVFGAVEFLSGDRIPKPISLEQAYEVVEILYDGIPPKWRAFFHEHKSHFKTLEKKPYVEMFEECPDYGATNGSELLCAVKLVVREKHLPKSISLEQAYQVIEILSNGVPQEWRAFFHEHKSHFETLEEKQYVKVFKECRDDGVTNGSELFCAVKSAVRHKRLPKSISLEQAYEVIEILFPNRKSDGGNRGAWIVDGLNRTLEHKFDLNAFEERINGLFDWHNDEKECKKYTAPYFALVQSSGMGKTKLFTEYRKLCKKESSERAPNEMDTDVKERHCLTILCEKKHFDEYVPEPLPRYYDHIPDFDPKKMASVKEEMDKIIKGLKGNIILLFDEAQGLMKVKRLFSDLRWWLRESRRYKKVVAVFAGTTPKLSNFNPPAGPPARFSRDPIVHYENSGNEEEHILYPPFFQLHTISCLRKHKTVTEAKFPDSVIYGRPLFAHYVLNDELDQEKLKQFAGRLVLSKTNYEESPSACYSVLGSRVQMGTVNRYDMLTELVSSGYACLVESTKIDREGQVTFMPDPLCAFLAMQLMNGSTAGEYEGKGNEFWVGKAREAFETKLCRPDKGDAGEIFAALYMLFCGDHLRKQKEDDLRAFSVKLDDWFNYLKSGGRADNNPASPNSEGTEIESTISFIQVCRNDYRSKPFFKQKFLEHLYLSGLGIYAYSNCAAFDIVSSIRVKSIDKGEMKSKYHPLLVSVKNWDRATNSDVSSWLNKMKTFVKDHRVQGEPTAVCIILLLGCSVLKTKDDWDETTLSAFPQNDIYCLVRVPEDDAFGIFKAVQSLGRLSEESEIYSSHAFAACEASAVDALRASSARKDEVTQLFEYIGDEKDGDGHAASSTAPP